MEASNMSIEFHEWLDECPVHWFRKSHDPINNEAVYLFVEESN